MVEEHRHLRRVEDLHPSHRPKRLQRLRAVPVVREDEVHRSDDDVAGSYVVSDPAAEDLLGDRLRHSGTVAQVLTNCRQPTDCSRQPTFLGGPRVNADRGTTAELADWVVGARAGDVPADVLDTARLLLLDGLGCGLFGSTQPWSQLVTDFVVAGGGRPEATVWGTPHRVPAASAPLANGTAVHAFEYDDLH
ncbi:MAG: hypothetical protein GEU96_09030, partial [Propionibacteriales bacterium]|nr:hypothetical protein [Propionibacteriales bacterium]